MSGSRSIRYPVCCNAVKRYFTCHSCPSRSFSQHSHTVKLQRSHVGQIFLPCKLKKTLQRTTIVTHNQIVLHYSSGVIFSTNKEDSNFAAGNLLHDQPDTRQGTPRKVLVVLNPHSGHRSSCEVFYEKVQSIFKLSGFEMEVVETAYAGHAKVLASSIDLSKCPDGIVCVGGDGIINEVLNGLLCREDVEEAMSLPIGIIPAGSDNSLVWSVLGVRDPVSAAMAIAKGGSVPVDVFAVKWIQVGIAHFGMTAAYFGFLTDVLQLSEKFRLPLGPFRYFIAGLLKFLSLPRYSFEVEYLPLTPESKPISESETDQNCCEQSDTTEINSSLKEKWVTRRGHFLGILVCNHTCKTVQGFTSPVVAPEARHDDGILDLVLVHGSGRLRLFCFFVAFQFCRHLLLSYVEYVKVKSVKIRPVGDTHKGCGIDGELHCADGEAEWECSLLPAQCRLLSHHSGDGK